MGMYENQLILNDICMFGILSLMVHLLNKISNYFEIKIMRQLYTNSKQKIHFDSSVIWLIGPLQFLPHLLTKNVLYESYFPKDDLLELC